MKFMLALMSAAIAQGQAVHGAPAAANRRCSAPAPIDLSGPRPVVTINLANGHEARMVFDTGAMASTMDPEQSPALGLVNEGPLGPPFDRMNIPGAYRSTLRGLSINGLPIGSPGVAIMPVPVPGVAGVLSSAIFGNRLVEINFAASTLRICEREMIARLGPGYPYSGEPFALPALPATMAGQTFPTLIDTGSTIAIAFPMSFAQRLPLAEPLTPSGTARGHDGAHPVFKARIRGSLQVGPITLDSPEVRFTDVVPMPNIGLPLVRQMILTIDPSGRRAWARLPATAPHVGD